MCSIEVSEVFISSMRDETKRVSPTALGLGLAAAVGLTESDAEGGGVEDRFALLVAHDQGGAGQSELRYSHHDAARMHAVLTELGDVSEDAVRQLENPTASELDRGLDWLSQAAGQAQAMGRDPLAVFYYSGHARATALSLGPEEYGIDRLRRRLRALPVKVRLVILDACQSGRFSEVKGVLPAREFAVSSIRKLDIRGLAVMASSTGSELSQESEAIGGSFFTHHLTSGLRGAADRDRDGRVSLEEAYRYAYDRTVLATAATRVGRQHPTLELEVRGHGALVLTQPERASSRLRVPANAAQSVLIATAGGRVWAEVEASRDEGAEVPLPPGNYQVLLRKNGEVERCSAEVLHGQDALIEAAQCTSVDAKEGLPKSGRPWYRGVGLELGAGFGVSPRGRYTETLNQYGYFENGLGESLRYSLALSIPLNQYFDAMIDFAQFERREFAIEDENATPAARSRWDAHGVGLFLRAKIPLFSGAFSPYVRGGGGLGWARTETREQIEHHVGWHLMVAGGIQLMFGPHVGMFAEGGYRRAPIITNLFGETHDSGGPQGLLGLRIEF